MGIISGKVYLLGLKMFVKIINSCSWEFNYSKSSEVDSIRIPKQSLPRVGTHWDYKRTRNLKLNMQLHLTFRCHKKKKKH